MTGVYALIELSGDLRFRDGVSEGTRQGAGLRRAAPGAFTILRASWGTQGLYGHTEDAAGPSGDPPPNPVAQALLAAFGLPGPPVCGSLAICGTQLAPGGEEPDLCGLTAAQQRLIQAVHAQVCRDGVRT